MEKVGSLLELVVWDKDLIGKDYLGERCLPAAEWFDLAGTSKVFETKENKVCRVLKSFALPSPPAPQFSISAALSTHFLGVFSRFLVSWSTWCVIFDATTSTARCANTDRSDLTAAHNTPNSAPLSDRQPNSAATAPFFYWLDTRFDVSHTGTVNNRQSVRSTTGSIIPRKQHVPASPTVQVNPRRDLM